MFRNTMEAKEEAEIKSCFSASYQLKDSDKLFAIFIAAAKQNNVAIADYILNKCFDNAEARANFGNRQDADGNTAYHHAAQNNCNDIIILLNDKRKFNGKQKFFQFNLENNKGCTPLDLCCLMGHADVFFEIWRRAGKSNHNPSRSLEHARKGGSEFIIAEIKKHPKVEKLLPKDKKRKRDKDEEKSTFQSSTARMLAEQEYVPSKRKKVEPTEDSDLTMSSSSSSSATNSDNKIVEAILPTTGSNVSSVCRK